MGERRKEQGLGRKVVHRPRHVAAPLVILAGLLRRYVVPHQKARDAGHAPVGLAALVPAENGMVLETSFPRGRLPDLEHVEEVDEAREETENPADSQRV